LNLSHVVLTYVFGSTSGTISLENTKDARKTNAHREARQWAHLKIEPGAAKLVKAGRPEGIRERRWSLANFRGQGYDIRLCLVFLSRERARESAQQRLSLSKAVRATYLAATFFSSSIKRRLGPVASDFADEDIRLRRIHLSLMM